MNGSAVDRAFRAEWATVLASLTRRFGDVGLAEDATQDAFVTAAAHWPAQGTPPNPGGWLMTTARRSALDRLRRERVRAGTRQALQDVAVAATGMEPPGEAESPAQEVAVGDDRLRLMFMCCHPALALPARIALTLRLVGGLAPAAIAHAFLVDPAAMQQRLVRAKRKLRDAGVPFAVPGPDELPARVDGVLAVLYLVFNEGWNATEGDRLVRRELCSEAIRLARLVCDLLPDDPEARGLLALMLLHDSRAAARQDADGRAVPIADQDRGLWDTSAIEAGVAELERALRKRRPGRYQLQAAIGALHAQASSWQETDWPQIVALYGELADRAPSPIVDLNRAIAIGMADGPEAGLAVLAGVLSHGELEGYAPLHAAHAELLERTGDRASAAGAWRRAAGLSPNAAQRDALNARAAAVAGEP